MPRSFSISRAIWVHVHKSHRLKLLFKLQPWTHMKIPICICWTSDWLYQKLTCINSLRYDWFPLLEERYANWVDLHSNLLSETFCINEGALNWLPKREFQHYMYWYKTLPPYPCRYKTWIPTLYVLI